VRVLLTTVAPPYPPINGQRLRTWAIMRALIQAGHELELVTFCAGEEEAGRCRPMLEQVCRKVILVPEPRRRSGVGRYAALLGAMFSRRPQGVLRFRSEAYREAVRQALTCAPDLLIGDDIYVIGNLPELPCRMVLNKDDFQHVILGRYARRVKHPLKAAYGALEAAKLRRWERLTCEKAGEVMVCSGRDAAILRELCPGVRGTVVPNVIDVNAYRPQAGDDGKTLIYAGSLDWYPNLDAVTFFSRQILPRIRARMPEARFVITGRCTSPRLRSDLEEAGATVAGFVDDVQAFVGAAAISVVPLRIGSGTRLKILEAGALERAVVSTTIGAEGLDLADGKEIILADEPEAFSEAAVSLLQDPQRRARMGRDLRRKVAQQYSLEALSGSLAEAVKERPAVFEAAR